MFDGVEVGAVSWKEDQPCTSSGNRILDGTHLVAAEIVHYHDVAWPQAWHQNLLDMAEEVFAVDGAIKGAGAVT